MDSEFVTHRKTITAILVEGGAVTPEQVDVALARQRETGRRIGESLVELGFVSEEDIGWALARQLGLPFVDVRSDALDLELVRSFPDGTLRRLQAVPLFRSEGHITAAAADPTDLDSIDEFEQLCQAPATWVAATPTAINEVLDAVLGRSLATSPRGSANPAGAAGRAALERSGGSFLDHQIAEARHLGIHEIHFGCEDGWLQVSHRLATRWWLVAREPVVVADALLARFESLGMKPLQSGETHREFRARWTLGDLPVNMQASVIAGRDGLSVLVRLTGASRARPDLETHGFEALDVAQLREALHEPCGLVLVSGPKGSGCGATLWALLAEASTGQRRWAVFSRTPGRPVVPRGVQVISGPLLAHWRRLAVTHSLDGVVVDGGLEGSRVRAVIDPRTHGRWVIARTDWEDSFAMLDWLMRAPAGRATLARRLRAVVQQRLVATPRANTTGTGDWSDGDPRPSETNSGALRVPVFEVLHVSDALRDAVLAGVGATELRSISDAEGFRPLSDVLRTGVQRGRLDPRDAARAA